MPYTPTVTVLFRKCVAAIRCGELIRKESEKDKEFHFQNWIRSRLAETGFNFEIGGRNTYPDFSIVQIADGYEVKGLAYPGRETNYDSNSQVPSGFYNGRTIYYIFGRYPRRPDGDKYPVCDLVICHGDFLNVDHDYVHKNKSVKGFGSYGDILIRDRKMYVAPTPFGLVRGSAHQQTLILPANFSVPDDFKPVGKLIRRETERLIVGYSFDLRRNVLTSSTVPNPSAGKEHEFQAWRLRDGSDECVEMQEMAAIMKSNEQNDRYARDRLEPCLDD